MNKLAKVGLSALCGSLAAVSSANAGEMTVTGGVDMTWMSLGGANAVTGNPIGVGSNLTFKGEGELDNGWTFTGTIAMLNAHAYSSAVVNVDMGGLGAINVNQGDSGNGIDALDDKMPTAWEEAWGNGLGTGIQLVSGVGPSMNIQYTTPTIMGTTITLATAPRMGVSDTADKGSAGLDTSAIEAGYDATISINPSLGTEILSGWNVFSGAHYGTSSDGSQKTAGTSGDQEQWHGQVGSTFDLGPVSIGYARGGILTGKTTVATDVSHYKNEMYGVAFNINDNLSASYGKHESMQGFVNRVVDTATDNTTAENANVELSVESYQLAYTMGGASIRFARSEVSNASYQQGTESDASVISLGLAF